MSRGGLTYKQACNHLLVGIGDYALFKNKEDPKLIVNRDKVVDASDSCEYWCTCGCKNKDAWSVHAN